MVRVPRKSGKKNPKNPFLEAPSPEETQNSSEALLGEIPLGNGRRLAVLLKTYNGAPLLGIQPQFQTAEGQWRYQKGGLSFRDARKVGILVDVLMKNADRIVKHLS